MIAGPGRDEIAAFWDAPTHQPVRIYVGLTASETVEERAKLAFDELRRVGGFERKYLILATPTGSAWLDPGAMDTLEWDHGDPDRNCKTSLAPRHLHHKQQDYRYSDRTIPLHIAAEA